MKIPEDPPNTEQIKSTKGFDKLFLNLAGFYRNSDGYFDLPDSLQDQYSVPLFLDEKGISANIGYSFNKNTVFDIKYDYYDDKRGEGVKINKNDGKHRQFDTNFIQATFSKKIMSRNMKSTDIYKKKIISE